MLTKIYKTRTLRGYSLTLLIDGKPEFIRFSEGYQVDSTAIFSTSDPKIQKALEALHAFGPEFYIAGEQNDEEVETSQEPVKEEKILPKEYIDAKKFKNLVEMKDALIAAGLKIENSWNYTQTKKFAFEHGYDYQVSRAEN